MLGAALFEAIFIAFKRTLSERLAKRGLLEREQQRIELLLYTMMSARQLLSICCQKLQPATGTLLVRLPPAVQLCPGAWLAGQASGKRRLTGHHLSPDPAIGADLHQPAVHAGITGCQTVDHGPGPSDRAGSG
jgi:hypothetical protein